MDKVAPFFAGLSGHWTAGVPLPGGDFPVDGVDTLVESLKTNHSFLDDRWARRLVKGYGTDARLILKDASTAQDLGQNFGATLTEAEVRWLMTHEFARTADDVLWRRSKLGLRFDKDAAQALDKWMTTQAA